MNSIQGLDNIIQEHGSDIDIIKNITPTNLNEENGKFLRLYHDNIVYNPQYNYNINPNLKEIKATIFQLNYGSEVIEQIYENYKQYLLNCIELINSVGDAGAFTELSIKIFGSPDKEITDKAIGIFAENDGIVDDNTIYDSAYLKRLFDREISEHHFKWSVKLVDNLSSKVAVDPDEKMILINKNVRFSENDTKRLLVHEFGTHVIRAENGSRQKYAIFQNGFPKSIETEEGLATYNEWKNNLLDLRTLKIYAGRVLAVKLCLENSFYEAFIRLREHFSEEECIRIISRVKRGLRDTSQKGAFTKDYIYLNGFYKVKHSISCETEKILYSGVIGLDDIEKVALLNDIKY